jgi:hypothetical protein
VTGWTSDELDRIGAADELELAVRRRDGTLRKAVTIWVVRSGDELYVRSWRGRSGGWFRAAEAQREGHLRAGGLDKDVALVGADEGTGDAIDTAYRTKYGHYADSYVQPMIRPEARATTLKLLPRAAAGPSR